MARVKFRRFFQPRTIVFHPVARAREHMQQKIAWISRIQYTLSHDWVIITQSKSCSLLSQEMQLYSVFLL